MISFRRWSRGERPDGHVPYRSGGRCPACDQRVRRARAAPPVRTPEPPASGFVERDTAWQNDALCAQVDLKMFFPDKGGSAKPAKKICGLCPVRDECLAYAIETRQRFGIWGGKSERELRRLMRAA
jgi:hypothetical protein